MHPVSIRCRRGFEPPVIPDHGRHQIKEVTMTRRACLWITAMLSIAATALMVGLTVAAQTGVSHAHTHPPLAGITFTALD
jgi:quercetin dioxygenase-like cupin family protein